MDEKTFRNILRQVIEQSVPHRANPWPAVQRRFSQIDVIHNEDQRINQAVSVSNRRTRLATAVILAILIVITVVFTTPQGRAWAQSALRFFIRSDSNTLVLPTPTPPVISLVEVTPDVPLPTLTPTPRQTLAFAQQCGDESFPKCTLNQIRGMLYFPVKELASLPSGLRFVGATGGPDQVRLVYRSDDLTRAIFLTESLHTPLTGALSMDFKVAVNTPVESVQIGEANGEYLKGMWDGTSGNDSLTWNSNLPIQFLRWMEGDIFIEMMVLENPDLSVHQVDKTELLLLARGLTDVPEIPTPQPIAEHLSIAEAEALAGFHLLIPDKLPREYRFSHTSYIPDMKTVCLIYQNPGDYRGQTLSIAESASASLTALNEIMPDYSKHPSYIYTETLTVGGARDRTGLYAYGASLDDKKPCAGREQNAVLMVQAAGVQFSIYANNYVEVSEQNFVTRLEMVKLAESMTGIHIVAEDQLDPGYLHSVKDAEGFASFHIKQPTRLLPEMSLDLIQVIQEGQIRRTVMLYGGYIIISQSSGVTEMLDTIYNEDPGIIWENVTVNGQPALYSNGLFDNGKFITIPGDGTMSLIWFENGIEYRIFAGATPYDKEVFITMAESMR